MPIKKLLIFAIFGGVVFAGSIVAMLMLGKYLKEPIVVEVLSGDEKLLNEKKKQEFARDSNINRIVDKIYNKRVGFKDYDTELDESASLLDDVKPAKLSEEIVRLKET